eukprot:744611-Prymnesium_polylepis.1
MVKGGCVDDRCSMPRQRLGPSALRRIGPRPQAQEPLEVGELVAVAAVHVLHAEAAHGGDGHARPRTREQDAEVAVTAFGRREDGHHSVCEKKSEVLAHKGGWAVRALVVQKHDERTTRTAARLAFRIWQRWQRCCRSELLCGDATQRRLKPAGERAGSILCRARFRMASTAATGFVTDSCERRTDAKPRHFALPSVAVCSSLFLLCTVRAQRKLVPTPAPHAVDRARACATVVGGRLIDCMNGSYNIRTIAMSLRDMAGASKWDT